MVIEVDVDFFYELVQHYSWCIMEPIWNIWYQYMKCPKKTLI
jgi:hypothetical protein